MLDVMCVEPASNVTRLVQLLKMSSIPEKLKSVSFIVYIFVVLSFNLLSVETVLGLLQKYVVKKYMIIVFG